MYLIWTLRFKRLLLFELKDIFLVILRSELIKNYIEWRLLTHFLIYILSGEVNLYQTHNKTSLCPKIFIKIKQVALTHNKFDKPTIQ